MYNPYNNQMYMNDLQNMRDRIDRQMQQMTQTNQQPTPITQNFQLAPNQNNNAIKYMNDINDVKKELVFCDTLFVNKDFSSLWFKNASGEITTYKLKKVVELDEKDKKINELMARIELLESERVSNEQYANKNVNDTIAVKKPTNGKSNTTSNE